MSTMGERLAWARNQQGFILQQVSERSGLAIGYISQLEKGVKVNPTLSALERLAGALNVTVEFILGNLKAPSNDSVDALLVSGQAFTIRQRFLRHLDGLSPSERRQLTVQQVEERLEFVVNFLCTEFSAIFTRPVIAYQLGLSVRTLNGMLEGYEVPGFNVLHQMSQITGIPFSFFGAGEVEGSSNESHAITPEQALQYFESISMAVKLGYSPEALTALIKGQGPRA